MSFSILEPALQKDILRFRFGVYFLPSKGIANALGNALDVRFQKVSGLKTKISTSPQSEGGQNLYTQQLPDKVEQEHLVLERGMMVGSPLNFELRDTFSLFSFNPANVLVILFDDNPLINGMVIPVSAWLFTKAYPVSWATSDLDASEKSIMIDTLELAYSRMQIMRI